MCNKKILIGKIYIHILITILCYNIPTHNNSTLIYFTKHICLIAFGLSLNELDET